MPCPAEDTEELNLQKKFNKVGASLATRPPSPDHLLDTVTHESDLK